MSYFALLDSDSDNEKTSNVKVAVKKETKDTKGKTPAPVAAAPTKAVVDSKIDNKQKENKNANSSNAKDQKKAKDDKKPAKKEASAEQVSQVVDPDVDAALKEHRMDREHGKTKHYHGGKVDHGGRFGGRGGDRNRRNEGDSGKPTDPKDHEHGVERAPRKREYDRRSATGRSGEQRKGGRGPHSFGNEKQEGVEAEKDPASAEHVEDIDPLEPTDETAAEPVVPEVELPKVFTYDEYLAKKKNESDIKNKELFEAPKAIRTVEKSEFKGLKTKEEEETVFLQAKPAVTKTDKKSAPQRSTAKNSAIDVSFKVVPAEETPVSYGGDRDRGYGGRGGGRGGGDRRNYHGSRSTGGAVDLSADLFPSL